MLKNKYKADIKLKNLVETSASLGHRSLLFLYDSKAPNEHVGEQVMIIHHLIAKLCEERPSILWCHKKGSVTPKAKKSVLKKLEKNLKAGNCDISVENAFNIFLLSTQVTFCEFAETQSILGKTFGMCVIQDFEGLTANNLCRMTETVSGGGAVVFILPKEVSNLREMFHYQMDVHRKLKTYSHPDVQHRFNERFVISLGWCPSCQILDNELQVRRELTRKKSSKSLDTATPTSDGQDDPLQQLLESVADAEKPLPQLAKLCRTMDQAKAVLKMIDVVTEKTGRSTVSITAARGRGKSAAIGLGTAAAIFFGVNNIYVTSPSPENLSTYFEFLFKGFDALDYKETSHYDIIQSTNPEFKKAIVRVNIFARHRQIIQYVSPADHQKVSQAELVVIDEAAAIPLVHVQALLGKHNVFMASTINGYEGTGRSLSLKLLKQLRQQTVPRGATATASVTDDSNTAAFTNCRPLHEITLETSIRYRTGDPLENWLNKLLCLDATEFVPPISSCPHSDMCDLYYVNRDVLFSGHSATESFLLQVVSLLVSSHYRNSPDDMHALADCRSHHLFVLVPRMSEGQATAAMPPVFAVIQASVEGSIPAKVSGPMLERGESPDGDLIPWSVATHFMNPKLTRLKGLRIVRVATHPDYQSMGYGSRAVKQLQEYYERRFLDLDKEELETPKERSDESCTQDSTTLIGPRTLDEPLLVKLKDRTPESMDYIGVSFGVTEPLLKFWKKAGFIPINLSQSTNQITGEHNCIMTYPVSGLPDPVSELPDSNNPPEPVLPKWLKQPAEKFFIRFLDLLGGPFTQMSQSLAFKIISSHLDVLQPEELSWSELENLITGHDLKRLAAYTKYHTERHLITDLLPAMASLYFRKKLPSVHLSPLQAELLIGCGLQYHPIDSLSSPNRPVESVLGQFKRAVERIFNALTQAQEKEVAGLLPKELSDGGHIFTPVTISLEQDLKETAEDYTESLKASQEFSRGFLKELKQYTVKGTEADWEQALANTTSKDVSIKSLKRGARMTEAELEKELADPNKKKLKITKALKRKDKYGY